MADGQVRVDMGPPTLRAAEVPTTLGATQVLPFAMETRDACSIYNWHNNQTEVTTFGSFKLSITAVTDKIIQLPGMSLVLRLFWLLRNHNCQSKSLLEMLMSAT